ncbi:MAG: hypothetical protein WC223_07170 [Bacteroidales bacterium]|jgi:hypothetical protein
MRIVNIIFLIFAFTFLCFHCLSQNTGNEKNIIVLTKKKRPLSKPRFITNNEMVFCKTIDNKKSGYINNIGNYSINIDIFKIDYKSIYSLNNMRTSDYFQRTLGYTIVGLGIATVIFSPVLAPLGIMLTKTKRDNFNLINDWNYKVINTTMYAQSKNIADTIKLIEKSIIKDVKTERRKLPYINDSTWENTFYIYPLNAVNELDMGYERRITSRIGIEATYGIIYSWKNHYFNDILPNNYKNPFINNGYSFKLRMKYYYNLRNYVGINFLYKYFYFNKKSTYSFDSYDIISIISEQSASNRVIGLFVNFGYWLKYNHFIFDIYSGIGLKNIDGKITTYSYKFKGGSSYHYDYNPPKIESTRYASGELYGPNGRLFYPSIQLGIKIGYCFK